MDTYYISTLYPFGGPYYIPQCSSTMCMRTNLAGERAYIKDRMSYREMQALSTRKRKAPQETPSPSEPRVVSAASTKVRSKKSRRYATPTEESEGDNDRESGSRLSPIPQSLRSLRRTILTAAHTSTTSGILSYNVLNVLGTWLILTRQF